MYRKVIAPYFLGNVNQNWYLEIFYNSIIVVVELGNGNCEFRRKLIFQQYGCPEHSTIVVRN